MAVAALHCRWGADAGILAAKARQHKAAGSDSEEDSEVPSRWISLSIVHIDASLQSLSDSMQSTASHMEPCGLSLHSCGQLSTHAGILLQGCTGVSLPLHVTAPHDCTVYTLDQGKLQ